MGRGRHITEATLVFISKQVATEMKENVRAIAVYTPLVPYGAWNLGFYSLFFPRRDATQQMGAGSPSSQSISDLCGLPPMEGSMVFFCVSSAVESLFFASEFDFWHN